MKRIIKSSDIFIVLFLIFIIKDIIYKKYDYKEVKNDSFMCDVMQSDYNKLLEFNNIEISYDRKYINTKIIYKDIFDYKNEILIRGGNDLNVNNGDVIIYDNTLLGVVNKVNDTSSSVLLLTNKNNKLSVIINDKVGNLSYIKGNLIVKDINDGVKKNDMVFTSSLGNIKDKIYIGVVDYIDFDNNIYIKYDLDIKNIKYVTILKENL